jgi:hypothetical protein
MFSRFFDKVSNESELRVVTDRVLFFYVEFEVDAARDGGCYAKLGMSELEPLPQCQSMVFRTPSNSLIAYEVSECDG